MILIFIVSGGPVQVDEMNILELVIYAVADFFSDRHGLCMGPSVFHFVKVIPRLRFLSDTNELVSIHN